MLSGSASDWFALSGRCLVATMTAAWIFFSPPCSLSAEIGSPIQLKPELPATAPLSIEQVVARAVQNLPFVLQERELTNAAKASVKLQKLREYVPATPGTYQELFSSHNRLSQTLFSSDALPNQSGAAPQYETMHGWFSTGAGVNIDSTAIDFGLHKARISESKAWLNNARSQLSLSEFDAQESAANAFLDVIIAGEEIKARQATVDRFQTFATIAHSLVDAGLKPGADASLADGQLARAQNNLYRAQRDQKIANANLAEAIGDAGVFIAIDPVPFVATSQPEFKAAGALDFETHPLVVTAKSMISVLNVQQRVLTKSYYPILHVVGGWNGRGSGLNTLGRQQAATVRGLFPTVPNYQVGAILDFSAFDWLKIKQEKVVQKYKIAAEKHYYDKLVQTVKAEDERARATVEAAVKLAENMPVELKAAREAELRSRTRYQSGLASVAELAEAEQLLADTEAENAVVRVGVWKALLAVSNSHGDIKPFLSQVAQARSGGGM
jgi:outer membrane protein TolC